MRNDKELLLTESGSHLYGTNGPESDYDFKVLVLPSFDQLLLGHKVQNYKVKPCGAQESMKAGEEETEYVPLQVFMNEFFNGQTYALELAFAVLGDNFKTSTESPVTRTVLKELMQELVDKFLTRNVSKMVGYAVSQSQVYGVKTERYETLRKAVEYLTNCMSSPHFTADTRLSEVDDLFRDSMLELRHVTMEKVEVSAKGSNLVDALVVVGKKFPVTTTLRTMHQSLSKLLESYGDRVKKFEGKSVDWKALHHAVRVTEQALELSREGKLYLPRRNAEFLRAVKVGELELEEVQAYLTKVFNELDEAVDNSVLPERTPELEEEFEQFKLKWLYCLYTAFGNKLF